MLRSNLDLRLPAKGGCGPNIRHLASGISKAGLPRLSRVHQRINCTGNVFVNPVGLVSVPDRRNRLVITPNRKQLPGWTAAACCHEGSSNARSANSQNRTSVTVSGWDGHDGTLPQLLLLPTLWGCVDRLSGLSTYPNVTVPGQRQSTCSRPSWPGRRGHVRSNTRPDSHDCTRESASGRVARIVARPGATTPAK